MERHLESRASTWEQYNRPSEGQKRTNKTDFHILNKNSHFLAWLPIATYLNSTTLTFHDRNRKPWNDIYTVDMQRTHGFRRNGMRKLLLQPHFTFHSTRFHVSPFLTGRFVRIVCIVNPCVLPKLLSQLISDFLYSYLLLSLVTLLNNVQLTLESSYTRDLSSTTSLKWEKMTGKSFGKS